MAFRTNRKSSGPGPNPGLTPIDDIHGAGPLQDHEPDATTGRLPAQEESSSATTKRRRENKKTARK